MLRCLLQAWERCRVPRSLNYRRLWAVWYKFRELNLRSLHNEQGSLTAEISHQLFQIYFLILGIIIAGSQFSNSNVKLFSRDTVLLTFCDITLIFVIANSRVRSTACTHDYVITISKEFCEKLIRILKIIIKWIFCVTLAIIGFIPFYTDAVFRVSQSRWSSPKDDRNPQEADFEKRHPIV